MLQKIKESGVFSVEDVKELRVLLSNKSLQRVLNKILLFADMQDKLSTYALEGQEGLAKALKAQGVVQGLKQAVTTIIEASQEEVKDNG